MMQRVEELTQEEFEVAAAFLVALADRRGELLTQLNDFPKAYNQTLCADLAEAKRWRSLKDEEEIVERMRDVGAELYEGGMPPNLWVALKRAGEPDKRVQVRPTKDGRPHVSVSDVPKETG